MELKMSLVEAVDKTADLIEKRREAWSYFTITVPENLEDKGCAIGWISYFRGVPPCEDGECFNDQVALDGMTDYQFYDLMEAYDPDWYNHPVKYLRLFATPLRNKS